jgi:hypothetical protein
MSKLITVTVILCFAIASLSLSVSAVFGAQCDCIAECGCGINCCCPDDCACKAECSCPVIVCSACEAILKHRTQQQPTVSESFTAGVVLLSGNTATYPYTLRICTANIVDFHIRMNN